jgi:hypothetical protein
MPQKLSPRFWQTAPPDQGLIDQICPFAQSDALQHLVVASAGNHDCLVPRYLYAGVIDARFENEARFRSDVWVDMHTYHAY